MKTIDVDVNDMIPTHSRFPPRYTYILSILGRNAFFVKPPKFSVNSCELILTESVTTSGLSVLLDWVRKSYYNQDLPDPCLSVGQFDPVGIAVQVWNLVDAKVEEVDFGPINHEAQDPQNIRLKLRFKKTEHLA